MTGTQAPFDMRQSGLSMTLRDVAAPQEVFADKAGRVRYERLDGAVHLYRLEDILRINRDPSVLGTGGRAACSAPAWR